jgi:hypothetical protein
MIHITKIYLVTNCYNDPNKAYIGKTKNSRKSDHKRKFGDKIEYSEIDEINSLDKKDWEPLETYWINQFKSWGFEVLNKNEGGGGPTIHSEETKIKMSISHKGKTTSKEIKQKISISNIGRKYSEEQKLKMSISKKGKKVTWGDKISQNRKNIPNPTASFTHKGNKYKLGKKISIDAKEKISLNNSKPVIQYDKNMNKIKEYSSIINASTQTLINVTCIGACCRNKQKTAGGFIWRFII